MSAADASHVVLTDVAPRQSRRGPLDNISASLAANREQTAGEGILLTVGIENRGESPVTLVNPLDGLQILLLDEQGFPVRLPQGTAPRSLINVKDHELKIERPYRILAVENSRGERGLLAHVHDETLTLPENTSHSITALIDRVRDSTSGAEQPVAAGTYQLKIVLPLIAIPAGSDSRVYSSTVVSVRLDR